MTGITYQELEQFGNDVNEASDRGDVVGLQGLDDKAAKYTEDEGSDYAAYVWYFRSNIQAALQNLSNPRSWEWHQKHRERQILYLRRAAGHKTFIRLAPTSQAAVLTNLANGLSSFGRGIEAIELYDEALAFVPQFAMALGNRGNAMHTLSFHIPDRGHATLVAAYAHTNLKAALAPDALWESGDPSANASFSSLATQIESRIKPEKIIGSSALDAFSLGRSKDEQSYRRWALRNNLFLNPLMAIGPHAIAATDRMNLPSYVSPMNLLK